MRIRAGDVRVHEGRAAPFADVTHGFLANGIAFERIRAITFGNVQAGEAARQLGDAPAGRLDFDGDGDGIAVVLDEIEDGELLRAGDIQGFPELAFAGGTISRRDVNNLFRFVADVSA